MELGIISLTDLQLDPLTGIRADPAARTRETLGYAILADRLDVFGLGEHHTADFAVSSPAVTLSAAAALTTNIKLTTGSTVLNLHGRFMFTRISPPWIWLEMEARRSSPGAAPSPNRSRRFPGKRDAGRQPGSFHGPGLHRRAIGAPAPACRPIPARRRGRRPRRQTAVGRHFLAAPGRTAALKAYPYYLEYFRPKAPQFRGWDVSQAQFEAGMTPDGHLLIGTSDQLIDKILTIHHAIGIDRFFGQIDWGALPRGRVEESITMFSQQVAPVLRRELTPSSPEENLPGPPQHTRTQPIGGSGISRHHP